MSEKRLSVLRVRGQRSLRIVGLTIRNSARYAVLFVRQRVGPIARRQQLTH